MDVVIDVNSNVPIFSQLVNQFKSGISKGDLVANTQLPSIRQLANDLGVNPNTVSKAYKLLERDSVIVTKGYKGTFIHEKALENCSVDLNDVALSSIEQCVSKLKQAGLTDSEIRIAFTQVMKQPRL